MIADACLCALLVVALFNTAKVFLSTYGPTNGHVLLASAAWAALFTYYWS